MSMPDFSSLPWWLRPPFASTVEERRYRRRSKNHDYQKPHRRYMITIAASPLLLPLSKVYMSSTDQPIAEPTETGECFVEAFNDWRDQYKMQITAGPYVVMPDHVHFCFSTFRPLQTKFSSVIGRLMGLATNRLQELIRKEPQMHRMIIEAALKRLRSHSETAWRQAVDNGETYIPIEYIKFFSRGYTDSIALADRRWRNQLNYVEDNPRRLLFKRRFPEYFRERWELKIGDERFVAVGNVLLLKNPQLEVVRYSSKFSLEKNAENSRRWDDCIASGGVLVSPFIHPVERAAKEKAMSEGGFVIKICDTGFCERYVPSGWEFELMAEGRLLLMSDKAYEPGRKAMRRERAMELNELAELVASLPWLEKASGSRISLLMR